MMYNICMILFCSDCSTSAKTTDISSLLKEIYEVHLHVIKGMYNGH